MDALRFPLSNAFGVSVGVALRGKGVRNLLPERPEGCFAQKVIAVGTALTGGPPHRSVHEELHSYGSCLESSAKSFIRIRVDDSGTWEVTPRKALHPVPRPTTATSLAAATNHVEP